MKILKLSKKSQRTLRVVLEQFARINPTNIKILLNFVLNGKFIRSSTESAAQYMKAIKDWISSITPEQRTALIAALSTLALFVPPKSAVAIIVAIILSVLAASVPNPTPNPA